MAMKQNARILMYDRAINDYGKDFIDKLFELCKNVRRDKGYQKGESPWTINGLLRDMGKEIEREYDMSFP